VTDDAPSTFKRRRTDPPVEEAGQPPAAERAQEPAGAGNGSGEALRDAVGAYLLDALPEADRHAFESFLATSPEAQEEVRQLAPVVSLLPALFEIEPAAPDAPAPAAIQRERIVAEAEAARDTAEEAPEAAPAPSEPGPEAADVEPMEQLAAAAAEAVHSRERSRTIRTTPEGTGPFELKRRAGRAQESAAPTPFGMITQLPAPWLAAAALGIVAIGAILWALALQGRIDSKNREITAQEQQIVSQSAEIAELRQNANATSYTLSAAGGEARGTLLYSLREGIGVLYVQDLPRLESDLVYQLWYLDDQDAAPVPGGTFRVDRNGNGFTIVAEDTPTFDGIAITTEPEGGSEAPTSAIVLLGRLGGAAG
jgi:hypothetical protein